MTPGECDLGKSGRGPGFRNPPARHAHVGMSVAKIPLIDRLRSRFALVRHLYIFVLVVLIPVMPLFLRLRLTIAIVVRVGSSSSYNSMAFVHRSLVALTPCS